LLAADQRQRDPSLDLLELAAPQINIELASLDQPAQAGGVEVGDLADCSQRRLQSIARRLGQIRVRCETEALAQPLDPGEVERGDLSGESSHQAASCPSVV
jgi:hypothetical protein